MVPRYHGNVLMLLGQACSQKNKLNQLSSLISLSVANCKSGSAAQSRSKGWCLLLIQGYLILDIPVLTLPAVGLLFGHVELRTSLFTSQSRI